MTPTAAQHLNRIVQLVADVSRDPEVAERGVAITELAARLGTTPAQVQQDIRTLTAISDEAGAEWLQSLSVWQEGDRVAAVSRGPYRRPLRFTPEELLAIRVGLALEGASGEAVWRRLSGTPADPVDVQLASGGEGEAAIVALARAAMDDGRTLDILYAGEGDHDGSERSIEVHQIVRGEGRQYLVSWCRRSRGWRNFRADRVLDAALGRETFLARADFRPLAGLADLVPDRDEGQDVTVRYRPSVARWLAERFPDARRLGDGSVEVSYRVVEPAWLVRLVLQYGEEAVILAPASYRELMRRMVGEVAKP